MALSNDYAIINTGGKQYRVRPGDTVQVEKLDGDAGTGITFDRVLLASIGGTLTIGTPTVDGARVTGEISSQDKSKKVMSIRYKNKTRQHTRRGHRQRLTSVKIIGIEAG